MTSLLNWTRLGLDGVCVLVVVLLAEDMLVDQGGYVWSMPVDKNRICSTWL